MGRAPGFRFWATDGAFLALVAASTAFALDRIGTMAWAFPVVALHFFLFCNVLRVRRRYELIWAAAFLANVFLWLVAGAFGWGRVLGAQTPLTLLLVGLEVRSGDYHGIGWRRINPHWKG